MAGMVRGTLYVRTLPERVLSGQETMHWYGCNMYSITGSTQLHYRLAFITL